MKEHKCKFVTNRPNTFWSILVFQLFKNRKELCGRTDYHTHTTIEGQTIVDVGVLINSIVKKGLKMPSK